MTWLYDEQLLRCAGQKPSGVQAREVERLQAQMIELREVVGLILALGARLKILTIETMLAKSDSEPAVEHLLRGRG